MRRIIKNKIAKLISCFENTTEDVEISPPVRVPIIPGNVKYKIDLFESMNKKEETPRTTAKREIKNWERRRDARIKYLRNRK